LPEVLTTVAVGNGFILTAMLWGAFLAELIDRRLRRSALYLGICAGLTFFGIIHSALPEGGMYLPWRLSEPLARTVAYQFSLGYLAFAGLLLWLSFTKGGRETSCLAGCDPQ
jgi:AGZA family xanthine/uracil permease-like MFS transporter